MARYIGPRARVNRRFGASVFVPGNAEELIFLVCMARVYTGRYLIILLD